MTIPIRVRVGNLPAREVYRVSAASIAADPDGALIRALREVADEIERQAAEERQRG